MKLAYILSTFPKLSESFILNEIVELLKRGHDVRIFSMHVYMEDVVHEEIREYDILERTHYFSSNHISKVNFIKLLKYFIKALVQDLHNLKISKNGLKLNLKLAYFAAIMDEQDVELIHAHFANMGSAARRLSKMVGVPYTLTTHAFDIYLNPDADELRKVMADAASVVTISEYNKNYLMDEIGVSNRIDVIRCGIDLDKFNPQRKLKTGDRIRMLTVARLVEKKGIEYLLKAIPMVIKEVPDCKLTIVGSGPLNDSLHQLVCGPDVGGCVQFRGDVSDSELMQCYKDADMFILPCIIIENGDRDGIPVAMMEAMAMELPAISTNVSGIPELVKDGVSGMLVPPKDEKAIADVMIKLCKDEELRVGMGMAGRRIVEDRFNVGREAKRLIKLFRSISKNVN